LVCIGDNQRPHRAAVGMRLNPWRWLKRRKATRPQKREKRKGKKCRNGTDE
jgi:hypothetical protein